MRAVLSLACVIALASFGCGDDPIVIAPDDTAGTDAGTGTDAPTPPLDAPSTPACPPASAPAPTPDQCDAATLDCLVAAGTSQPMQMACLDADSSGEECLTCLNGEVLAACTTNAVGCNDKTRSRQLLPRGRVPDGRRCVPSGGGLGRRGVRS